MAFSPLSAKPDAQTGNARKTKKTKTPLEYNELKSTLYDVHHSKGLIVRKDDAPSDLPTTTC